MNTPSHLCRLHIAFSTGLQAVVITFVTVAGHAAYCMTQNPTLRSDLYSCHYSDDVYQSDVSQMAQKSPTHFNLMTSRYREIVQAARGYKCTGTTTVVFDGHSYFQAGLSDDPGLAELIPSISSLTGLSLANSSDLTELIVILSGILIGYAGYRRLCTRLRWLGLGVFLGIGLLEARVADVYVFQLSPLLAGFPWSIGRHPCRSATAVSPHFPRPYGSFSSVAYCRKDLFEPLIGWHRPT